jgi:hypothetical protein
MAPRAGFEPATQRLTAACSTTELPGISSDDIGALLAEGQARAGSSTAGAEIARSDRPIAPRQYFLNQNMVKSILRLAYLLLIGYFKDRNKFLTVFLG